MMHDESLDISEYVSSCHNNVSISNQPSLPVKSEEEARPMPEYTIPFNYIQGWKLHVATTGCVNQPSGSLH